MVNKQKSEVALKLNEAETLTLRFTFDAMERLEQAMGFISYTQLLSALAAPSLKFGRLALWAGQLHRGDDAPSPDAIQIPEGPFVNWMGIVANAIGFALGIVDEDGLPNVVREAMGLPPKTEPMPNGHDPTASPSASPAPADSPPDSASMS